MTSGSISAADLKSALPDTTSTVTLKGPDGAIQIVRDGHGIPHVRASSTHDAFFGQGFATAQDRLWHMDYDRRKAYGWWAEFVGESGVEHDKTMRRFRIAASVKIDWPALSAETRAMFEAYADGVNAFIDSTQSLPIEYTLTNTTPGHWRPQDSLAVFKVRHIMMGVFEGKYWRAKLINTLGPERAAELLTGYQPGHLMIVPPGSEFDGPTLDGLDELSNGLESVEWLRDDDSGSNNWALSGDRTSSGKPLVAGDPHRGLDTPNVYYQNRIAGPEFDVIGLSFPGCPGFPHFGHNADVAWCVTHAGADYQDLFIERLRSQDGALKYEYKGEWKPAEVSAETIEVRDGDSVEIEVAATHHGPIIGRNEDAEKGIAFRYTATAGPNLGFEALRQMMYASNADELDESMRTWVDPCNNFVFADVEGAIEYLNRGAVPLRTMANAWLPVPGWTGEHEWEGVIPFEELARSRDPENGFIVTANNRIVGSDYPYYIALDFASEHRARRIYDRLKDLKGATVEDMASVHAEVGSIPGLVYAKLIANTLPLDAAATAARDRIVAWDGRMDRDSVAPTIYSAFRRRVHQQVIGELLGPLADEALSASGRGAPGHMRQITSLLVTHAEAGDTSLLPSGTDWDSLISRALTDGVDDLRQLLGDDMDTWTWGRVHHTNPTHPLSVAFPDAAGDLDPPSVPMGGDGDTPQAGSYSSAAPYTMQGMSVARYVWDIDDWDNSRWIVPLGSSGHPGSTHYADQTPVWAEVDLVPATYSWDKVEAGAESTQTLLPDGPVASKELLAETQPVTRVQPPTSAERPGYEGSRQQYGVVIDRDVMLTMRDGVNLATDIYFPATDGDVAEWQFPVILERTPYNKATAAQTAKAKYFARRGYVCVIQDVRGRFESKGHWHPFAKEAPDGYDTVEWLGTQSWSTGKVGTMGDSYAGSDQAALATLNPPHLSTMLVAVGASNYFDSSMRQNGALEQRFLIYCFRMGVTSKEAARDPALKAAITRIFEGGIPEIVEQFPILEGTSILTRLPTHEQWAIELQTKGDYDDYWKQRGYAPVEYYDEYADVPTLYLGGWYDSYARNTCQSYVMLSKMKKSPQHLLMGPWTHGQYEVTFAGDIDFGLDAHIDYKDLKLAWFDRHLKGLHTEVNDWSPVRIFTMGGGEGETNDDDRLEHGGYWRNEPDWPLPGTQPTPYYFHGDGTLSTEKSLPDESPATSYVFDPSYPVPTIGGGISAANPIMEPGAYDQRGDPERFFGSEDTMPLASRADVLVFRSPELEEDIEVTGPIEAHLWMSSSAVDTDFTAKLVDVYPPSAEFPEGLAINITDSIMRARYRNGYERAELMTPGEAYELVFQLYPTSNVFARGHRIRVDVSSSNWPRFDVNHNTGAPLGTDRTYESARQTVHHSPDRPSHLVLPIQPVSP
ncbi:MAG: CocE/NonD family hydrolase [SAR202 cluster bacterium]|nr:CocE/NonD family hydrolase [SAR202 cluster bacterium]